MSLLKFKDAKKMSQSEQKEKLSELKLALVKANVTANKTKAKTKEIKIAISRLLTINSDQHKTVKKKPERRERKNNGE